jgi:hypothetical protein
MSMLHYTTEYSCLDGMEEINLNNFSLFMARCIQGDEVKLHLLIISVLDAGKWLPLRSGHFTPE